MSKKMGIVSFELADTILTIASIISFLAVAYMLILKLTGHSPTEIEVLIGITVSIALNMARIEGKLGELKESKRNAQSSIRMVISRLDRIESRLQKLDGIEYRLQKIEAGIN
ncbi:hypothetical protein HY989_04860 [Candidatus Micrarchaeota archaeon]|nr:hypothetical protein [Candidatus Micrarchaeota archaeon]